MTMGSAASKAEAVAVRDDVILAVGREADVMALAGAGTRVIDLHGRTMLPGFVDGHSHFSTAGLMEATQINLSSFPVGTIRSLSEIKEIIRRKAATTPKGEWILGYGYDDTGLEEKRHPTAADLDEVKVLEVTIYEGSPVVMIEVSPVGLSLHLSSQSAADALRALAE